MDRIKRNYEDVYCGLLATCFMVIGCLFERSEGWFYGAIAFSILTIYIFAKTISSEV